MISDRELLNAATVLEKKGNIYSDKNGFLAVKLFQKQATVEV